MTCEIRRSPDGQIGMIIWGIIDLSALPEAKP